MEVRAPFQLDIGGYAIDIGLAPRGPQFNDRRRRRCTSLEHGVLWFDEELTVNELTVNAWRAVVHLLHHTHGIRFARQLTEESLTHSLAGGLVTLASVSPEAWRWLNYLADKTMCKGRGGFAKALDDGLMLPCSKTVSIQGYAHRIRAFSEAESVRLVALGAMDSANGDILLLNRLKGRVRANILVHETLHAIHMRAGISDKTLYKRSPKHETQYLKAVREQTTALLRFIGANPKFWRHFLTLAAGYKSESADVREAA